MSDFARTISTDVRIRGQKFNANELVIQSFVNGGTTFSLSGAFDSDAKAQESSVELPTPKFVQEAAELQRYILETPRLDPDVYVSVDALNEKGVADQNIAYAGYLSSPNFGVTGSMVSRSFSVTGLDQQLAMFIGSIYSGVSQASGPPLKDVDLSSLSFAELLLKVLDWLMSNFKPGLTTGSALDAALEIPIHERNKRLMPFIRSSLEASQPLTVYPDLKAVLVTRAGQPSLVSEIVTELTDCIVAQPNLLIGLTGAFIGAFPCLYVPAVDESGFRLRLIDDVMGEAKENVTTPTSMAFNAGSVYALPLKGVVVTTALPVRAATQGANENRFLEKMAAIYPPGTSNSTVLEGATFQKIGAPRWLPNVQPGVFATGLPALIDVVEKKLDAGSVEGRKKLSEELFEKQSEITQTLLNRYCRSQYYYLALAGAKSTLNLPLNFSFVPGVCYRISDTDDKGAARPLFTGFAQSVTHRIKSDGGGEALTTVMMSHLRMEGFELPG